MDADGVPDGRSASWQERAILFRYCWEHPVGECVACARTFRHSRMIVNGSGYRCPHCRRDLTATVHAHLYGCALLPADVRRRAQRTREASRTLIKESRELLSRADVLRREAEIAMAAVRDAIRGSTFEGLRRLVQQKLEDGSLPYDGLSPTMSSSPGDGSTCGVCEHVVTKQDVMMIITREASPLSAPFEANPIRLHAECFRALNDARRGFDQSC